METLTPIATIDQHEIGLYDPGDRDISSIRLAARGVVFDQHDRIAVVHFVGNGSYKLPGGAMAENEDIRPALQRWVRDEVGYTIIDIQELGVTEEDRYFCGMHQTSYCYMARADKYVGVSMNEAQAQLDMELVWLTIDSAIAAIDEASAIDDDGSELGLRMMKLRDVAILRAVKAKQAQAVAG